jgi:hypothetical protein
LFIADLLPFIVNAGRGSQVPFCRAFAPARMAPVGVRKTALGGKHELSEEI